MSFLASLAISLVVELIFATTTFSLPSSNSNDRDDLECRSVCTFTQNSTEYWPNYRVFCTEETVMSMPTPISCDSECWRTCGNHNDCPVDAPSQKYVVCPGQKRVKFKASSSSPDLMDLEQFEETDPDNQDAPFEIFRVIMLLIVIITTTLMACLYYFKNHYWQHPAHRVEVEQ